MGCSFSKKKNHFWEDARAHAMKAAKDDVAHKDGYDTDSIIVDEFNPLAVGQTCEEAGMTMSDIAKRVCDANRILKEVLNTAYGTKAFENDGDNPSFYMERIAEARNLLKMALNTGAGVSTPPLHHPMRNDGVDALLYAVPIIEKRAENEYDIISHPAHYAEGRQYEPRLVIVDWELDYYLGNALKYISRAGRKGSAIEDLRKAKQYIDFEIELLEKNAVAEAVSGRLDP